MGVDHYENFPVASILCPPALRPTVVAIYVFARTADDIADEGDAPPDQRLADLGEYRQALGDLYANPDRSAAAQGRWPQVFGPLAAARRRHDLPQALLGDLLSAFEQDVRNPRYATRDELLDYCRRSANPIGRLLLHLYGVGTPTALHESDAICSALQLINFWQDLGIDLPRGRNYLPQDELPARGLPPLPQADSPALRGLVHDLCDWAESLMREGASLVHRLPGRAGWELRLVVQGGLRILEKIRALDHASFTTRPTLSRRDAPTLLWRALRMRARR